MSGCGWDVAQILCSCEGQQQFQQSITVAAAGQISGNAILVFPSTVFLLLRDLLSFVLRVERPTAAKNKALDAYCPFPHSIHNIRRGITGIIFLGKSGKPPINAMGAGTELNFFARTHLLRKRISSKFC